MDYERMWNILKEDVITNRELSDYISINKLIEKIKKLEEQEKDAILKFKDGNDLSF